MKKQIWIPLVLGITILAMSTQKAFAKITNNFTFRGSDNYGSGTFGAPRDNGTRKHQGVDVITVPGQDIVSPIAGTVTRFPFPYGDDLRFTGIEIKNDAYTVKIFYVTPTVKIGTKVNKGTKIAVAQDLKSKYPNGITNHAHFEVRDTKTNELINPTNMF